MFGIAPIPRLQNIRRLPLIVYTAVDPPSDLNRQTAPVEVNSEGSTSQHPPVKINSEGSTLEHPPAEENSERKTSEDLAIIATIEGLKRATARNKRTTSEMLAEEEEEPELEEEEEDGEE